MVAGFNDAHAKVHVLAVAHIGESSDGVKCVSAHPHIESAGIKFICCF